MRIRKIIQIFIIILSAVIADRSFAGVEDSFHDMYLLNKGTDPNVCSYCHVPHKAVGDKIWSTWANEAQLASGPSSHIGNMCYTCHDGTVSTIGLDTVFNTALQQHKTGPGMDCNNCHTVHDNSNGKFLGISMTQSANTESPTYCETCHDATAYPGAGSLGDHFAGSEHPYKDDGILLDASCNSCHQMHGAANYATPTLTKPILRFDNTNSEFCALCHSLKVQPVPGGNIHPANLDTAGAWGKLDCETCHDPHQPADPGRTALLKDSNVNSAYCTTCHNATDVTKGPNFGIFSHPTGASFATVGLMPSANEIDDDDDGPDYPANSASVVCESCHSAHSKGLAKPLLRGGNNQGDFCFNCHNDKINLKYSSYGLKHNMAGLGKGTDPNVCSYCHVPHNAIGEKIWSSWANEAQLTSGPFTKIGNMCYSCHDGTATTVGQTTAFNNTLQQHKMSSSEDCDMCHDPHDGRNGKFMKVPKTKYSYCESCHDGAVNAGGLGDHTFKGLGKDNHPYSFAGCNLCHAFAHGAPNYSTPTVTNPILLYDNTDSQQCGMCHFWGPEGLVQPTTGGKKHPANTTGGAYGKLICQTCHDPHQPGVMDHPHLLTETNVDSQMCINCHDGAKAPTTGHSHPYQVPFGSIVPLDSTPATGTPPGNQIKDFIDVGSFVQAGPDYPANSANLICETCHGVHHKIDNVGTKLLRLNNTNSEICVNCHQEKQ